jgi:hypothetical protein
MRRVSTLLSAIACGAFFLFPSAAQAATYTWNGGASGQWDTASNWSPNFAWTATGGMADFTTAGAAVTVNSVIASGIVFNASTTVSGGTISLIQGNNNLVNNASGTTTISSALNLIPRAATLTVFGPATPPARWRLTVR